MSLDTTILCRTIFLGREDIVLANIGGQIFLIEL